MSTVREIGIGKMHEFAICLDKAGFNFDLVQRIVNARGNKLAKTMLTAVNGERTDERFYPLNEFSLTIPRAYDHATQLSGFAKEYRKKSYYWNDNLTDANFAKATRRLEPGKTYTVKIFGIRETVTSGDCLAFLKSQNAILVGAQGLSLVWQETKDQFPVGKWTVSFDEKGALWPDAVGCHRVPDVYRHPGGGWEFYLGHFEHDWGADHCLLCLCHS